MKIVIDTSVLISAVFRNRIPEDVILFIAGHSECEWIVSEEILEEYRTVLARPKFALSEDVLNEWYEKLDAYTIAIPVDMTIDFPRDRKDAPFIACTLAAQADFFVTGDRDFSEAQKIMNTTIISRLFIKNSVMQLIFYCECLPCECVKDDYLVSDEIKSVSTFGQISAVQSFF